MNYRLFFLPIFLAACATPAPQPAPRPDAPPPPAAKGGYYKDDGPGERVPPNLAEIPDAEPKAEPLHRYANRPYKVFGTEYVPVARVQAFRQQGVASWYGRRFHGNPTASGEPYDMYAMTAAHPTLPIPSYVRVSNPANGRSVVVRVNDRGPFHAGRVIDLSYAAAHRLGFVQAGSARVELEAIVPGEAQGTALYVQLGAFGSRENAQSLQARLAQELAWLQESVQVLLNADLWRLHVGPYRSHDEARSVARRIEAELDLKPLVVVR